MKDEAELTPWFPGKAKPHRVGVYRRRGLWIHQFGGDNWQANGFAFWDGIRWSMSGHTPELAVTMALTNNDSGYQPNDKSHELFEWRGLLKETK